ncbi:cytochrome c oxidase assembly protein COX20, mitochondrial [Spea bombifrons]|uniref:cytochrome c oxidase assembly protein COX20, mitochondrial n=1 Tax=Spea bombifrons TaxID=233779 RepID=UPI00234BDFBD|nr:cytochrome c oxidase assembly protein COX20, mitochondrial [Spea bombifrons]
MADEETETAKEKSFKLLGILDVKNTPCSRESILYGSAGSLVIGLGHFLATSRIKRSCDLAVGGFIATTLGCWLYCRYNIAKLRLQQSLLKDAVKNKILYEGSSMDPNIQNRKQDS